MKRLALLVTSLAAGLAVAAGTGAAGSKPTLTIRHQLRGCHSWSFQGGPLQAAQSIRLKRGATIRVVDDDVMPHTLVQLAGPRARYAGSPAMRQMSASVGVTFPTPGVYRFTTKAGEDYMKGVKTIGEDNVLTLRVTVS